MHATPDPLLLTDEEQAIIDRIVSAPQAWVPVRDFDVADAPTITNLVNRGWCDLWRQFTTDGQAFTPSVTLTPWAAERLEVRIVEYRSTVTESVRKLVKREGVEKTEIKIRHSVIADELPRFRPVGTPDPRIITPRMGREHPIEVAALEDISWKVWHDARHDDDEPVRILGQLVGGLPSDALDSGDGLSGGLGSAVGTTEGTFAATMRELIAQEHARVKAKKAAERAEKRARAKAKKDYKFGWRPKKMG
jgi:hypothetical protein